MNDSKKLLDALKNGAVRNEASLNHAIELLVDAADLANSISKMDALRTNLEYLSDQMHDAGDPGILMSDAIEKTGLALAATVTYFSEYLDEAFDIDKKYEGEN